VHTGATWRIQLSDPCALRCDIMSDYLVKATDVTAGLAESNGSLLPGLWRDSLHVTCGLTACTQWCIAENGGGYTQRGVTKGLKVPCLFMIAEVSRPYTRSKNPGCWYTPCTRVYPPPQYTTACTPGSAPGPTLGNEYEKLYFFTMITYYNWSLINCLQAEQTIAIRITQVFEQI